MPRERERAKPCIVVTPLAGVMGWGRRLTLRIQSGTTQEDELAGVTGWGRRLTANK